MDRGRGGEYQRVKSSLLANDMGGIKHDITWWRYIGVTHTTASMFARVITGVTAPVLSV